MQWQARRAAGIPRGSITAAESVTCNYLMNYDPADGDIASLARSIVAEIAGALVILPGDAANQPRPHAQRSAWKGPDGEGQHGPWHPCPTCPQEARNG
jgi:hypothetical protein